MTNLRAATVQCCFFSFFQLFQLCSCTWEILGAAPEVHPRPAASSPHGVVEPPCARCNKSDLSYVHGENNSMMLGLSRQRLFDLCFAYNMSIDDLDSQLWPSIIEKLPNSALCSLAAANKACWQLSCHKRTLTLELTADDQLHSRLVSLLYFLTSRRGDLQVCCPHQQWCLGLTRQCPLQRISCDLIIFTAV